MVSEELIIKLGEILKNKYGWKLNMQQLSKLANILVDYCLWNKEVEEDSD